MGYAESTAMHSISSPLKSIFGAALGAAALFFASTSARADEAVALNTQAVVLHYNQDGSASSHPNGSQPTWISHADCEANIYLQVSLNVTGTPLNVPIEVWAGPSGIDCTDPTQRTGTLAQCWQVANPVTPANVVTVKINAQDIVTPFILPVGQKPAGFTPGNAAGCDTFSTSGPVAATLYFIPVSNGTSSGTAATYGISIALIGPAAPTGVKVGAGDTLIKVDWTPVSDANTQGFQVFCDPPPGKTTQTVAEAGTTTTTVEVCADGGFEDGGFDDAGNPLGDIPIDGGCTEENQTTGTGGSTGGQICSSTAGVCCQASAEIFSGGGTTSSSGDDESGTTTVVTGAKPPPADIENYKCGDVGSPTSTEALVTGLTNGTATVVGVAAYDVVGNVGPMSDPSCESPTPVDDFWKDYKAAGGGAGGGFCSVDKTTPAGGLGAFVLVGLASAISIARRRISKKRSART